MQENIFTRRLTEEVRTLEKKIQDRVKRILPLIGEDSLKKIIGAKTATTLLQGAVLRPSGTVDFSVAEVRFFKLPPAWLKLVIRFLNDLIAALDSIERDKANEGKKKFIPLPAETEMKLTSIGMEDLVKRGEIVNYETELVSKNGYRKTVNISASALKDKTGTIKGMVITAKDISDIQRLTIERNRALVESEVLKAKAEFSSVFSHQLRSPLSGIKFALISLLEEEGGNFNKEQKKYLEYIQQGINREMQLIEDLLYAASLETKRLKIEFQPTQLEDFIQKIINEGETLELAATKKYKIVFQRPKEKLPQIQVDQNLVRQIFLNLLTNAIRYSKIGKCNIFVTVEKEGESFLISVKDSGIGIPEKAQPKIFQKFFRAKNALKIKSDGTGLGLYINKILVEALGGKIWFASKEGKGATFYFTLPLRQNK